MTETSATRETGTFLDKIVAARHIRLSEDRVVRPRALLEELLDRAPPVRDFETLLRHGRLETPTDACVRLIAEIKRASPSKGLLNSDLDAVEQARLYARAGAAAISVLTEPDFFAGSIQDLEAVSSSFSIDVDRPALLRKEFIWDEYQIIEARAFGADSLLLIVMLLESDVLRSLIAYTRELGMEPLIEVHDELELKNALDAGARVVGVNNRDLTTFEEDLETTERLSCLIPDEVTLVAESAIRTTDDSSRMISAGAHALLIGEALVTGDDVMKRAHEFMVLSSEVNR
tara:strand:+ start:9906 stop:10769 length:864 start_codon:yes stop_codon:yes gene_type:complete